MSRILDNFLIFLVRYSTHEDGSARIELAILESEKNISAHLDAGYVRVAHETFMAAWKERDEAEFQRKLASVRPA